MTCGSMPALRIRPSTLREVPAEARAGLMADLVQLLSKRQRIEAPDRQIYESADPVPEVSGRENEGTFFSIGVPSTAAGSSIPQWAVIG